MSSLDRLLSIIKDERMTKQLGTVAELKFRALFSVTSTKSL
jgi:hypothetical protein